MKVAIAGLGSRGRDMYAKSALLHPDKMEIVALADTDPKKVALYGGRTSPAKGSVLCKC